MHFAECVSTCECYALHNLHRDTYLAVIFVPRNVSQKSTLKVVSCLEWVSKWKSSTDYIIWSTKRCLYSLETFLNLVKKYTTKDLQIYIRIWNYVTIRVISVTFIAKRFIQSIMLAVGALVLRFALFFCQIRHDLRFVWRCCLKIPRILNMAQYLRLKVLHRHFSPCCCCCDCYHRATQLRNTPVTMRRICSDGWDL